MRFSSLSIYIFYFAILTNCSDDIAVDTNHFIAIQQIDWLTFDSTYSRSLNDVLVSIEIDIDENIWIGTSSNGLLKFDGKEWTVFKVQNSGLSNDSIHDMKFDNQNTLWIGTSNGLTSFDGAKWTVYNTSNTELPRNLITSVSIDKKGSLWLGCGSCCDGGLVNYNGTNWILYTPDNSILPCRIINDIFVDSDDNIWVATWQYQGRGGLVKIDKNENWTLFNADNSVLPYNQADVINQDLDGNIWVGYTAHNYLDAGIFHGGLYKYNGKNWKEVNPHSHTNGLTNRIESIEVDQHNNIWIATIPEGGPPIEKFEIAMFNGKDWYIMSDFDSLFPNSFVKDLKFDSENNLWIGHSEIGLTKMDVLFSN